MNIGIYGGKHGESPSQQPLPLQSECHIYIFGEMPNGKITLGRYVNREGDTKDKEAFVHKNAIRY